MERKVTITVDDEGFGVESDFPEHELVFWLEWVKLDVLSRLKENS